MQIKLAWKALKFTQWYSWYRSKSVCNERKKNEVKNKCG